jgi:hypothetical protein
MLARIDRFLFFPASILGALAGIAGATYARRGACRVLPTAVRRALGRLVGARAIDARSRILDSMRRSAWSRLALELSIEHSAGQDGYRFVAAEGQGQHPQTSRQRWTAKQAHWISPSAEVTDIMT